MATKKSAAKCKHAAEAADPNRTQFNAANEPSVSLALTLPLMTTVTMTIPAPNNQSRAAGLAATGCCATGCCSSSAIVIGLTGILVESAVEVSLAERRVTVTISTRAGPDGDAARRKLARACPRIFARRSTRDGCELWPARGTVAAGSLCKAGLPKGLMVARSRARSVVLPNSDDPAASWGGFRALACACSRRLLRFAGGGSGSDRCR